MDIIILIIVYTCLILTGIYSVFLYRKAYHEMKKTRVIQSVYLLLTSILIENIYFCLALILRDTQNLVTNFLFSPIFWAVPKLLLLITLCYFILSSLSKNTYKPKKNNEFKDKI